MRIIACLKLVANPDVVELDLASETLVNLQPVPDLPAGPCPVQDGRPGTIRRPQSPPGPPVCPKPFASP